MSHFTTGSLLLYTALRTLSTRSYHHISIPQTCLTRTRLSLYGQRAITNLLLRTKHPIPRRHGTLDQASDVITRARLLAVSRKESLAWLHAVPNSSLGLRMDNETIRVAVGLCLYAAHTLASIVVQQLTVLHPMVSAAVSVLVVPISSSTKPCPLPTSLQY